MGRKAINQYSSPLVPTPIFSDKKMLLLYSFYLSLGSVSLFIFITSAYATYQAIIWKYTMKYILNSSLMTLVLFVVGLLLMSTCLLMVQGKKAAKVTGILGCGLFIIYTVYVILIDWYVPYSFNYILIMVIPAMVLLILSGLLWKKEINKT